MRIGGIASGIDTESIIRQLMQVERQPLDRMFQQKQTLEWQRDAYREVNTMFTNLERAAASLRFTSAINTKTASTPASGAFTAVASASVQNGDYQAKITNLATKSRNISTAKISAANQSISTTRAMADQSTAFAADPGLYNGQSFSVTTYDANGAAQTKSFTVDTTKSLNALFTEINGAGLGIKAYYDSAYDKVVLERTETGAFNKSDGTNTQQIEFSGETGFLTDVLKLDQTMESSGENAIVEFVNLSIDPTGTSPIVKEQRSNSVSFGELTINATKETTTFETFTISSNTDQAYENIKSFIDKYNETITELHGKLNETRNRDYPPLTNEQRREMSEREAELWDENAKSGLIRRDPLITSALDKMRTELYSPVDTTGQYSQLSQIGIKTASDYRLNGILEIDETKLRKALEDDPASVYQLFNHVPDKALTDKPVADRTQEERNQINAQTGLIGRIRADLNNTMRSTVNRAGNENRTNQQFIIGRELISVDSQIDNFERRLAQIESRYWAQFSRMEQVVNRANAQGAAMMNQLGMGGGMI